MSVEGALWVQALIFTVLAIVLAVFATETHKHAQAKAAAKGGWISLGIAAVSALLAAWVAVFS